MPQHRMSGRQRDDYRLDIGRKNKFLAERSVKEEDKFRFGVISGYSLKSFEREITDSLQLIFD